MKTGVTIRILPCRAGTRKTGTSKLRYPPHMNLLVLALACKPSGEAFTLEIDLQLPPNQLDLFDDVSSVDLIIESDGGTETYPLTGTSAGERSELIGIDPLDEATVSIAGYDGGELVAFGRSEVVTQEDGEEGVSILVARVDDFAWVGMEQETALTAVASTGEGSFLLFGGATGEAVSISDDPVETLDTVWSLPVAPPSGDLSFETVTTMPPMDEESFDFGTTSAPGRLGHTVTRLSDNRILLVGGAADYQSQGQTSNATWLFDPTTNTYSEGEPLSERRTMHSAVLGPTGLVYIIGGFGSADTNMIAPLRDVEIFDPDTLNVSPTTGNPSAGMVGAGAARLGGDGVLVCGGLTINNSAQVFHNNACDLIGVSGALSDAASMPTGLIHPVMTTMGDDAVLVTGGYIGDVGTAYSQSSRAIATDEAWIYRDGSWSQAASMKNPRAQHAAVELPDGRILVAGGANEASNYFVYFNPEPLACAEIYDPQSDTWTEVMACSKEDTEASLPFGMVRPGFDADPNYGVLLAGGHGEDGIALNGAAYFIGQPEL